MALPPPLEAEVSGLELQPAGRLTLYRAGPAATGVPLLLLHSVNAAASAYEVRPLFEHFARSREVYALDWPGFSLSERRDIPYLPELFVESLLSALERIGRPADLVALSLGGEFAAAAALRAPERFRSLTIVSPTGLGRRRPSPSARAYRALSFPLWAQPIFDLLASPASIRAFLKRSFVGAPDPGLVAHSIRSAHQPGALRAPFWFLSGALFSPDALELYRKLPCPGLILYDQDGYTSFERLPELVSSSAWKAVRIVPSKGLPHFERLAETVAALENFWITLGGNA